MLFEVYSKWIEGDARDRQKARADALSEASRGTRAASDLDLGTNST
jgi:hypothetical protein